MSATPALSAILERLPGARRSGSGWMAPCPAHADKNPSLAITEREGKILLHCFADCTLEAVLAAAGIEKRELFSDDTGKSRIVAEYAYTDERGKLLYVVERREPKDFRQRRPDGNDWIWKLNGTRRVLYHLPDVLKAKSVLVPEGEKDCETASKMGIVATCNSGGAGKWRKEYSETLRGKRVCIIADADEPGRNHAQQVAESVRGKATMVKLIELPGAKDLTEWIEHGGTRERLLELIHQASEWTTPAGFRQAKAEQILRCYDCPEFLQATFSKGCDHLVEILIPNGGAVLMYGLPKSLKSWIATGIGLDAACGRPALDRFSVASPVRTLLVQVEDRPVELQKRLGMLITSHGAQGPEKGMLGIVPRCALNLQSAEWRKQLEEQIAAQKSELVILDVLRRLFRGDVLSARDTAAFLETVDAIRDKFHCAVLLVHHSKKARTNEMQTHALGSVNLAAWADVLINVTGKGNKGATTQVELQVEAKSDVTPQPIQVVLDPSASPMLRAQSGPGDGELTRAQSGLSKQWTSADLARVLAISDATASRRIQDWSSQGLIQKVETRSHGLAIYSFAEAEIPGFQDDGDWQL